MNPTQAAILQRQTEDLADAYYRALPAGVTVTDAMLMPWSGERNLALRKALGIRYPSREVVMVNQGDVIQCVLPRLMDAREVANRLRCELPGWTIVEDRRRDRQWLVTGYLDVGDDTLDDARTLLEQLLDR